MNSNNKELIGINSFVRRQTKGSGKTYSTLSFEDIKEHAEQQLKSNIYKRGYRDGVILVPIDNKFLNHFICPIVKIDKNTKFETIPKRRRDNEEIYLSTKALNGTPIQIGAVDLILYRHDVLKETQENETDKEWELIAFHAIPKGITELPMGPITMMRNQLCLEGGTKGEYSSEEWANSVHFWQKYALLK
tara:strand:+ start:9891 stop:10460 length:570 start_codon:yes stop_codon:yes gene_type:complete